VDLAELWDHSVGRALRRFEAVQPGGKSREPRIIKVGLLDLGGESGDEKSGIEQRFRDMNSQSTVGSGYQGSLLIHSTSVRRRQAGAKRILKRGARTSAAT